MISGRSDLCSKMFERMIPLISVGLLLQIAGCGGSDTDTDTGMTGDILDTNITDTINPDLDVADTQGDRDGLDDESALDGLETETTEPVPGGLGWPCQGNQDCDSLFCVASNLGPVCTILCIASECPKGYSCRSVANTQPDVIFICVPDSTPICSPCSVDGQCGDGSCVTANDASFCSIGCTTDENCPENFECLTLENSQRFCVPTTGACDCRPGNDGEIRACVSSNLEGACRGIEECVPETGWGPCNAPAPAAETCNGLDDDCNGVPDDGFENTHECFNTMEGTGSCAGTERCLGNLGWVCDARAPTAEICDYIDNNCNGLTDEDFKDDERYIDDEHCGSCSRSCVDSLIHATAECSGVYASPQCVVSECEPGYHKVNEFQCISNMNTLCMPCADDSGCLSEGGRCLLYDDGRYCAVPCEGDLSCPTGYSCDVSLAVPPFSGQCKPTSNRCGCGEDNPNAVRSCSITFQNPDTTTVTCFGLQTCSVGAWTECDLPDESCDGLDNDCDGLVDEDFRDTVSGRFNTTEHCGECFNNCSVLNYPNSHGTCVDDDGAPFCSIECDTQNFNVNGELIDGCECLFVEGTDVPDGVDSNCDGIDGDINRAVFVARSGNDTADGSIDHPLRTISAGIDMAFTKDLPEIYVATGVYQESVELLAGKSIYGGYSPNFRSHDSSLYESVILAPQNMPGVMANGISGTGDPTIFDGFTVYGSDPITAAGASYAILIRGSDSRLSITNNRVIAGNGGNGSRGEAGTQGRNGVSGTAGLAARDVGGACGESMSAGGNGGALDCGETTVNGGSGGNSVCPDFDEDAAPGSNPTYPYTQSVSSSATGGSGQGPDGSSLGGSPGFDQLIDPDTGGCANCVLPPAGLSRAGQTGSDGLDGLGGGGGSGCTDTLGTVVDGLWTPSPASGGMAGIPGNGGGGGGSGGGVETVDCQAAQAAYTDLGGSGGGGGSGACQGSGGQPGLSGGASFAIFISEGNALTSLPNLAGNTIRAGRGGNGGDGGAGGLGGSGGKGGAGGLDGSGNYATYCAPAGGKGGNGGDGGAGGGGGGGCGGPSFCFFVTDYTLPLAGYASNNTCEIGFAGAGGMGGASLGAPGTAGATGAAARSNYD